MDIRDLLPIGSVVLLERGTKRLMVSGVKQTDNETGVEYDYIGVIYPEGSIGDQGSFLFNHENIADIVFRGFEDEERDSFIERLAEYYENAHA